jgi:hypothetical protein
MEKSDKLASRTQGRRPWEPPALKAIGSVSELVQSGQGKTTAIVGDPGDPPFKPPGQG